MNVTGQFADQQAKLWNGPAGQSWVEAQQSLDRLFEPFERLLVSAVGSTAARRVLDVGCGTGATTLAVAQVLGADGRAVGIDISAPMIELARRRARQSGSRAEFIVADAATLALEPEGFDAVISRFGVMFFDDPARAFENLRRATRAPGQLRCIVFRSAAENPFMTAAERAAAPLLPDLPARRADGPGQFAFADAQRVRDILARAGWQAIDIEPLDVVCTMPEKELRPYLTRMGPVGLLLREADEETRNRVGAAVRAAFHPYVHENEVCFTAACWMLKARA